MEGWEQMKQNQKIIMPILTLFATLLVWEICVRLFHISLYILPSPSMIAKALLQNSQVLWMHSLVTLKEALIGLFIATLLACIIAIFMDLSESFRASIFPHLIVSQTVPVMILGPLFSIWFGFDMAPKIVMVIFMCFFPITISFSDALQQVDKKQINLLKSFGAKKWQIYTLVKIPAAASALFSGLKVSATYCIGGAIVGEWLSASAGLGYYMIRAKNGYMLDRVFACVIVIIFWSILLHLSVILIERFIFPYKKRKETNHEKN